VTEVNHR